MINRIFIAPILGILLLASCESQLDPNARITPNPSRPINARTDTLSIPIAGTVKSFPEMGFREVSNLIQSAYVKTSATNREFRRAMFEVSIPKYAGTITQALLVLQPSTSTPPLDGAPNNHVIFAYAADLSLDINDYERPSDSVGIITITNSAVVDITDQVRSHQGRALGIRIQLVDDPDYSLMDNTGVSFTSTPTTVFRRIEVTVSE